MGKKGAIKSGGGDVSCTTTPYVPIAPLPRVAWCGEWRGLWCLRACVWGVGGGACQLSVVLHRAEQKETTDSLFPLFY